MTSYHAIRQIARSGILTYDIRHESMRRGCDYVDAAVRLAWRDGDRETLAALDLPGWPTCECSSEMCDEPATTTDDGGNRVCAACVDYAVDDVGECHCAAHDPRVIDAGEWTGGGMHGTPTGWVSRYVIED